MKITHINPLHLLAPATLALLSFAIPATAQSPSPTRITSAPLQVDRADPASSRIIPANAKLDRIATGFTWTEGPIWVNGSLFFAEIPSNSIRRWTPGKGVSIFLQPSGYKGATPYGGREPGSNGMTLDAQGRLTVAGHAQRDIFRFESLNPDAQQTVLADRYQSLRLNSPNDLVYRSDGSIYFTDPPYGLRKQNDSDPEKELQINGVYRIPNAAAQKPGTPPSRDDLQLLISNLPRPNGIAFSPGEKFLYVDSTEPKKIWMRYTVLPDGTLADPTLLYDGTNDSGIGGPDGMKVDVQGNIYSAGPGGVVILSPEGKRLATLLIPERVGNVAWGGSDRKTLYICASTSVYRVKLSIPGEPVTQPPPPIRNIGCPTLSAASSRKGGIARSHFSALSS